VTGVEDVMAGQCTGRGVRGVVVAAAPIAAAIGAEALRAGGNAYDAVVAAALAETVLLPPKCGIAGDLVALGRRAGTAAPDALLAIGPAPAGLAEAVRAAGALPDTGPLAVGVPGAPSGYAALASLGVLALDRLAAPAIALARHGFVWAPICAVLGKESRDLVLRHNPGGTSYYPGGEPLAAGAVVRLPGLATVLEEWAARKGDVFGGEIGDAVVARVQAEGGVLARADLAPLTAEWCSPASASAGGWDLWATPAPTHGPSLLDAIGTFVARPERDAGAVLSSVRAAAVRRSRTLADPLANCSTSMVSAADADGNAVVVVHSNSYPRFGSGLVVDEYDLILANRAGRGFTADEAHPNFPHAGQRPATTLHAWGAGRAGCGVEVLGGTPGGENQMPWNAQMLAELLAGVAPERLVVRPRWEWSSDRQQVAVEAGIAPEDRDALAAGGVAVADVPRWSLRCAQQVVVCPRPGQAIVGAVDPRTGGLALGV
jgi:gamma-glutamyltranspeptidase/glutathione hydrolase